MDERISREQLHDFLQREVQQHQGLDEALLSRWVLLREVHLPNGELRLSAASGDAGGRPLYTWEASGFHLAMLLGLRPEEPINRVFTPRTPPF